MSYLCLNRDVKEGEYAVFSLFSDEIIVKKDKGEITVAKNACKHRGFKVASCAGRGTIKCQYHGQRFEYEQRYRHHEFGQFVFLPHYLGKSEALTKVSSQIGEEFGSHTQFVKAPFHLWMQNTADPNHLINHNESFRKLFDTGRPENVYISEFESSYTLRVSDDTIEKYKKHFDNVDTDFFHYIGFPNLSVTSFLGLFYSVESARSIHDGCEVTTRFFTREGAKVPELLKALALEANKKILEEDKAIVEKWAVSYKYKPDTQWLPGEERVKRYADEIRSRGLE